MTENPWATRGEYLERLEREKRMLDAAEETSRATKKAAYWAKLAALAASVAAGASIIAVFIR